MINLFIDTNVLLSFFHFTSDDLDRLHKLAALVKVGKVALWIPDQVRDEVRRNRDKKIAEALKGLKERTWKLSWPQMCKDYSEYETLQSLIRTAEEHFDGLLRQLDTDISKGSLKADRVLGELFDSATRVAVPREIVAAARLRVDVGNPPGKQGSLGDAVNWESLLEAVPHGEELSFVSDDKDYFSPLDDCQFNSFLSDEWRTKKEAGITFYRRLTPFFNAKNLDISLAGIDEEKDQAIAALAQSHNFTTTHWVVAKLATFDAFSPRQAEDLARAALDNNQVNWILDDEDVYRLMSHVLAVHGDSMEVVTREQLAHRLAETAAPKTRLIGG